MNHAVAHYKAGRYAQAEAEARALAATPFRLPDDSYAQLALSLAAAATSAQGRHAEALAAYDALLPVFGRTFGAEHWQTLKLRSDRAHTLGALDRHAECEAECVAVARVATRGTQRSVPLVTDRPASRASAGGVPSAMALIAAAARNGQIYALNGQGRHSEAEALAREALAAHSGSDRMTLVLRVGLARSLSGQTRHKEALAEAERADELRRSMPAEQRGPETGAVELAVATALLGLGLGTEARPQAVAAHGACLAAFGPDHHRTAEARALLDRIIDGI